MSNSWGENVNIEWKDKKHIFGMPISLTRYSLVTSTDWTKIFVKTGLLFTQEEEINLYRIYDLSMSSSLGEKFFGLGTIVLYSKDESSPVLELRHIKNPKQVRSMLARMIEEEKMKRGFRVAEFN